MADDPVADAPADAASATEQDLLLEGSFESIDAVIEDVDAALASLSAEALSDAGTQASPSLDDPETVDTIETIVGELGTTVEETRATVQSTADCAAQEPAGADDLPSEVNFDDPLADDDLSSLLEDLDAMAEASPQPSSSPPPSNDASAPPLDAPTGDESVFSAPSHPVEEGLEHGDGEDEPTRGAVDLNRSTPEATEGVATALAEPAEAEVVSAEPYEPIADAGEADEAEPEAETEAQPEPSVVEIGPPETQSSDEEPEGASAEPAAWALGVARVLEPMSLPMKFVPESMKPIVSVIALTLVAWVPIVWVLVLMRM